MKFALILVVVLFGIWLWRTNREADPKRHPPKSKTDPQPLEMVRCTLCSVHVPQVDAVKGKKGLYCTEEHLHRAEP